PAHEVGEWVERIAEPILSDRAQKIAEIEGRTSDSKLAVASMALVQGPIRSTNPDWDGVATKPDEMPNSRHSQLTIKEGATDKDGAPEGTPGTQLTQVSSQERIPLQRRSRWVAGVALLAIAFGGAGWLVSKNRTHAASIPRIPEPPPMAEVLPRPPVTAYPL